MLNRKNIIAKLPEILLSAVVSGLAGVVIYWWRGNSNAPYICFAAGATYALLRPQRRKEMK